MMKNRRHAFIFDMDGVLTDNMRFHADSWVELFRDFGLKGLDAERYLKETAGMKGLDVLRHFLGTGISEADAQRFTELKDFLYRVTSRSLITPLPGLGTFLEAASKLRIALGIGTGASPKNITYVLDLLNLGGTFQAVVDPGQVSHGKPQPDIFLRVADLLDVPPESCLVFEDALPGVEAALSAGMQCVAITTTNSAESFSCFDNVVAVIQDFTSISPETLHDGFFRN